jgi:hypothetical protein
MRGLHLLLLFATLGEARTPFWAPVDPPRAEYSIRASINADGSTLAGSETIRFRNGTSRPIGRVAFDFGGTDIRVFRAERVLGVKPFALFELANPVEPGGAAELKVEWSIKGEAVKEGQNEATWGWYPRLAWGFGTLDDYDIRLDSPTGLTTDATGRFEDGVYRAKGVLHAGLFVGKGVQVSKADAGGVQVRAIFTPKGEPCAQVLLRTAGDAIGYYRGRFGTYPHNSLTIVPGGDYPAGGYPVATAMVAIHGQERMAERPDEWWKWITAHEIGHMYWSHYVLAKGPNPLDWLMIGLGIHADREYRRARGIKNAGELWPTYSSGVAKGYDTTMDIPPAKEDAIKWDFNNVVIHGKSSVMLNALESAIGASIFDKAYMRCLREYAGRRLGWRDFQRIAEQESGEDLDWFFDQWVRSGAAANYKVAANSCDDGLCRVLIERTGDMRMPVTVAARFVDGTEQRAVTERLADSDTLVFRSKSSLKDVKIEPDSALVLAEAPPATVRDLRSKIESMADGPDPEAPCLYALARETNLPSDQSWLALAWALYDGRHYAEALDAFARLEPLPENDWKFLSLVWQGHMLDLLGRRPEAIERYQAALAVPGTPRISHDQYKMNIDKAWVEERLKMPFTR